MPSRLCGSDADLDADFDRLGPSRARGIRPFAKYLKLFGTASSRV
jgi:hypothetical protein